MPDRGGYRKLGRSNETKQNRDVGYAHIHTAIDAYSRLAYSAFAGTENAMNCVAFLDGAVTWFAAQGVPIERILTGNGNGYRSHAWKDRCDELGPRPIRVGRRVRRPGAPASTALRARRGRSRSTGSW